MFILELLNNPFYFFTVVILVIVSITLHELSHAVAAYSQGDSTAKEAGKFTLNPLAHMDKSALVLLLVLGITWGQTPVNPAQFKHWWSDAWVSFAGPLTNAVLMVLFTVGLSGVIYLDSPLMQVFQIGAVLNGVLFLLNMIPLPPLDGYTIAETFIPLLKPNRAKISQYGFFVLVIAVFILGADRYLFEAAHFMVGELLKQLL